MKNILILTLNKFPNEGESFYNFTTENNEFNTNVKHINEAAIRYVLHKFEKTNKTLDAIFMFVNKEYLDNGSYERFKGIFPNIFFDCAIISSKSINDCLKTAPEMCDKIIEYKDKEKDDAEFIIDMTGDLRSGLIMSSFIRLVKYNNFKVNNIFYANTSAYPNIIEEITGVMNLQSLISGADEFISYGSTNKIQDFFAENEADIHIKKLVEKMAALSETLRVCGNYEATENVLVKLNDAIENYELLLDTRLKHLLDRTKDLSAKLKNCDSYEETEKILAELNSAITEYKEAVNSNEVININEFYFNKLLARIKIHYGEILPKGNVKSAPSDIIRWCLKSKLIQQAVIFFTEWIPSFLVEQKYLIVDKTIKDECIKRGQNFSHWSVHFFRAYQPKMSSSSLNAEELKEIFQQNKTLDEILANVQGKNAKIEKHLKEFSDFFKGFKSNEKVTGKILQLQEKHFVHKLILMTQALAKLTNISFEEYVKKTFTTAKNAQTYLINRLRSNIPQKDLKKLFDLSDEEGDLPKDNVSRAEIMKYLADNNLIKLTIPLNNFLDFIDNYELIVQYFRNKMAHAVINDKVVLRQDKFVKIISESLDLIEKK